MKRLEIIISIGMAVVGIIHLLQLNMEFAAFWVTLATYMAKK